MVCRRDGRAPTAPEPERWAVDPWREKMKSRVASAIVLAICLITGIRAEWKENGKVVPDTPWAKSAGDFGAQVVFTDKPDELFAAWEKPGPVALYSQTTTAKRGVPIVAVIFFVGCAPDDHGQCNAGVRFSAFTPDGKPWGDAIDAELWVGKPAPQKGQMQLSVGNMGIVIDPDDPLGTYKVKAEVVDKVSKKTIVLERTFVAIEADPK